jgi:hypothetical protein
MGINGESRLDPIDSMTVREIAGRFGELVVPAGVLAPSSDDPYVIAKVHDIRIPDLETLARVEGYLLCYAMYNLPGRGGELDSGERIAAIRRSHSVVRGYGRLSGQVAEGRHNERSVLLHLQTEAERWLTYAPSKGVFEFTAYGQTELERSYTDESGCPAIGMGVRRPGGEGTKDNLFLLYWEAFVIEIGGVLADERLADSSKQEALDYIYGRRTIPAVNRSR